MLVFIFRIFKLIGMPQERFLHIPIGLLETIINGFWICNLLINLTKKFFCNLAINFFLLYFYNDIVSLKGRDRLCNIFELRMQYFREKIFRISLIQMRHFYGVLFINKSVKSFVIFYQLFQRAEKLIKFILKSFKMQILSATVSCWEVSFVLIVKTIFWINLRNKGTTKVTVITLLFKNCTP